jgi:flavin reductase (DIM6/NTAB) family NADH-FMN oxidoreductase RutF
VLWGRPIAVCFVRPDRYTYGFMEEATHFTLSFFAERHREALNYCGTNSGRDGDKIGQSGLTCHPVGPTAAFEEASLIVLCRKLYTTQFNSEGFTAPEIRNEIYGSVPYHWQFIGEIESVLSDRPAGPA